MDPSHQMYGFVQQPRLFSNEGSCGSLFVPMYMCAFFKTKGFLFVQQYSYDTSLFAEPSLSLNSQNSFLQSRNEWQEKHARRKREGNSSLTEGNASAFY